MKRTVSTERDVSPPPTKRRITTTTTKSAVANFFKPKSDKEPEKTTFSIVHDSVVVARYRGALPSDVQRPVKITAFDLDGTIIVTQSGKRFAKTADDWQWWNAIVPSKLKQLVDDGYVIVMISNQAGISLRSDPKTPKSGMLSLNNFKTKVQHIFNALDLPISLYAATAHDQYRKPRTGVWTQILKDYSLSDKGDIDHDRCMFVGDAAGRRGSKDAGTAKDHSCSDRDFATNVKIPFSTPDEFFLGQRVQEYTRIFEPSLYISGIPGSAPEAPALIRFKKEHDVEVVLFCGSPGAGKSTFYWKQLKPLGYERVNQDILKTRDRCMKVALEFIGKGTSVAVDNTNADRETRAAWIKLTQKAGVPIRLVHFTASAGLCEHNSTVRALAGESMNPEARIMLPRVAFIGFSNRYQAPDVAEGFADITPIDFKFDGTEEQRALWSRYWIS